MNITWYLLLCLIYTCYLHGMESNNNNEKTPAVILSLKNLCANAIAKHLVSNKITPSQVARLPEEQVDLVRTALNREIIQLSPFNYLRQDKYLCNIINGRYLYLIPKDTFKSHSFFDMTTNKWQSAPGINLFSLDNISSTCPYAIGLRYNGKINNWTFDYTAIFYDIQKDATYPISFISLNPGKADFIRADDSGTFIIVKYKKILYIYSLHVENDKNIIATQSCAISPEDSYSFSNDVISLKQNRFFIEEQHKFLVPSKYSVINCTNGRKKSWYFNNTGYVIDQHKTLIAYRGSYSKVTTLSIHALDAHPDQDKYLPALSLLDHKKYFGRYVAINIFEFLYDSSHIISSMDGGDMLIWHWPAQKVIRHISCYPGLNIRQLFISPNYCEIFDKDTLYRLSTIDIFKKEKIKKNIDYAQQEITQFRNRYAYLKDAQRMPIPLAIEKTAATLFSLSSFEKT